MDRFIDKLQDTIMIIGFLIATISPAFGENMLKVFLIGMMWVAASFGMSASDLIYDRYFESEEQE